MDRRRGTTVGAGALVTLAALAAMVQLGLLWLALFLGGFIVHGVWFWRRVLRRSDACAGIENERRISYRKSLSGGSREQQERIDSKGTSEQDTQQSADAAVSTAVMSNALKQRQHKTDRTSGGSSIQESGASEHPSFVCDSHKATPKAGDSDTWDDAEFDSADEADSEAEQDSLLPAAEHRRRLPRRMSFSSYNLAAGCFPPAANVKHNVVSACLYTANLPATKAILHLIEGRLLNFHRFRSVPVVSSIYPYWREVAVNPAAHVRRLRVWLIENAAVPQQEKHREHVEAWDSKDYRTTEERLGAPSRVGFRESARHCIIVRAEHCIGDGVSLIELGMRLLTDAKGLPLNEWKDPPILKAPATAADEHLCHLPSPTAHLLRWTKVLMKAPCRIADALWVGALLLLGSIRAIAAALVNKRDACTPLTGPAASRNHLRWCPRAQVATAPPISLDFVRAIKKAANATLNDVFVAAFTGAVRRYCELQGDMQFSSVGGPLPKILMACGFFRLTKELPDTSQLLLRNRFTLTSLELPADSKDARETLHRVKESTSALKRSRQAAADFICQKILGQLLPRQITRKAAEGLFSTHSVVFSNLPAYTAPVCFCGSEITEVQILYPNLIPQVEVLSYAGRIFFSLVYDPSIVAEGHRIPHLFLEELHGLADAFGVPISVQDMRNHKQGEIGEGLSDTATSCPTATEESSKTNI